MYYYILIFYIIIIYDCQPLPMLFVAIIPPVSIIRQIKTQFKGAENKLSCQVEEMKLLGNRRIANPSVNMNVLKLFVNVNFAMIDAKVTSTQLKDILYKLKLALIFLKLAAKPDIAIMIPAIMLERW